MIRSVLVANRGEIARRVFHTCRGLGIGCVAVYSDPDSDSPHVIEADAAIRLAGNTAAETYLRGDPVIRAALDAGADAVHPGYGFLSENAEFAQAVIDAGLIWIGPQPKTIESMGSKVEAKRLMVETNVPVLPELDPETLAEAELPVLIKASAGGGGRGMRVVRSLAELPELLAAARLEAESAFGDPTVFCEPYLYSSRHVEVQVVADAYGMVLPLGERECSIQRRHQKIVEEAPSPLVQRVAGMRQRLFDAATLAAKAVGYSGVGTVEFIADDRGRFFFLEMNTRLQVEHPVTECTTGLDLVALQLRIAEGLPLDIGLSPIKGHAIEARLYAEDPARNWQACSGTIHRFAVPGVTDRFSVPTGDGLRLDSGLAGSAEVSPYYDPMLAKVIAVAGSREEAARHLAAALAGTEIHGLTTNRDLLVNVLRHPSFREGDIDTAFFDRHGMDTLSTPLAGQDAVRLSALAAALAQAAANRERALAAGVSGALPSGWRNVVAAPQRKCYLHDGDEYEIAYRITRDGLLAEGYTGVNLLRAAPNEVVLECAGIRRRFAVAVHADLVCVDSSLGPVALRRLPRFRDLSTRLPVGSLVAPMPGTVIRIAVTLGDIVHSGQPLLWLEAMKMEHQVDIPVDGVVSELDITVGQQVEPGAVLAVITEQESR